VVSALGEVINDGVIHPEEKVKVKVRLFVLFVFEKHKADTSSAQSCLCGGLICDRVTCSVNKACSKAAFKNANCFEHAHYDELRHW